MNSVIEKNNEKIKKLKIMKKTIWVSNL
jgi:hypothetical protein